MLLLSLFCLASDHSLLRPGNHHLTAAATGFISLVLEEKWIEEQLGCGLFFTYLVWETELLWY